MIGLPFALLLRSVRGTKVKLGGVMPPSGSTVPGPIQVSVPEVAEAAELEGQGGSAVDLVAGHEDLEFCRGQRKADAVAALAVWIAGVGTVAIPCAADTGLPLRRPVVVHVEVILHARFWNLELD